MPEREALTVTPIPPNIGKPALRALHGQGFRSLLDLAQLSEFDISRLHGVGPKAVGILRSALESEGLAFATAIGSPEDEGALDSISGEVAAFFEGRAEALRLFRHLHALIDSIGSVKVQATRSQVSFTRRRGFAWAWTPDLWLKGKTAPLVLSIALPHRDSSSRWKEVVEPRPGRWMHHLEIESPQELDDEVEAWLREAWQDAS